jgi:antitoxin CcdA
MPAARRATSLSLDRTLLDEAKSYGINISRAAEAGVLAAVKKAKTEAWQRENAAGIEAWNRYIDEHGLPLEKYRMF